jgi:hypothetical protein
LLLTCILVPRLRRVCRLLTRRWRGNLNRRAILGRRRWFRHIREDGGYQFLFLLSALQHLSTICRQLLSRRGLARAILVLWFVQRLMRPLYREALPALVVEDIGGPRRTFLFSGGRCGRFRPLPLLRSGEGRRQAERLCINSRRFSPRRWWGALRAALGGILKLTQFLLDGLRSAESWLDRRSRLYLNADRRRRQGLL